MPGAPQRSMTLLRPCCSLLRPIFGQGLPNRAAQQRASTDACCIKARLASEAVSKDLAQTCDSHFSPCLQFLEGDPPGCRWYPTRAPITEIKSSPFLVRNSLRKLRHRLQTWQHRLQLRQPQSLRSQQVRWSGSTGGREPGRLCAACPAPPALGGARQASRARMWGWQVAGPRTLCICALAGLWQPPGRRRLAGCLQARAAAAPRLRAICTCQAGSGVALAQAGGSGSSNGMSFHGPCRCDGGWYTSWKPTEGIRANAPPRHSDYRDRCGLDL